MSDNEIKKFIKKLNELYLETGIRFGDNENIDGMDLTDRFHLVGRDGRRTTNVVVMFNEDINQYTWKFV